ncbi:MAG: hypothetical protein ACTSUE_21685 [Promethearchaeota archaeon]
MVNIFGKPMTLKRWAWFLFHGAVTLNFILEIGYCAIMVFVVLNYGSGGPLFGGVLTIDYEFWMKRRLYAMEFWMAIIGFLVYLGLAFIIKNQKEIIRMRLPVS